MREISEQAGELHGRLVSALAAHDARAQESWSGPSHFRRENEAIGRVREHADIFLMVNDCWPAGSLAIGNDRCLSLLAHLTGKEKADA